MVQLPLYILLPAAILKSIENAASMAETSTDEHGDLFAMTVAEKVAAENVATGSVIVVPTRVPNALRCSISLSRHPARTFM